MVLIECTQQYVGVYTISVCNPEEGDPNHRNYFLGFPMGNIPRQAQEEVEIMGNLALPKS